MLPLKGAWVQLWSRTEIPTSLKSKQMTRRKSGSAAGSRGAEIRLKRGKLSLNNLYGAEIMVWFFYPIKLTYVPFMMICKLIWGSLVTWMVKNLPAMQEMWAQSQGRKDPWRRKWQPTPVYLSGKSHGQRSLAG